MRCIVAAWVAGICLVLPGPVPAEGSAERVREADRLLAGATGAIDRPRALAILRELAAAGDPAGSVRLAILHQFGAGGLRRDPEEARRLASPHLAAIRRRAEAGDTLACALWGSALLSGLAGREQPALALPFLRRAAEAKEIWALQNLAGMFEHGEGVATDPGAALVTYRRAAEAGNAFSMYDAARLLLQGETVRPRDRQEAMRWLRDSAGRGFGLAEEYLGSELVNGAERGREELAEGRRWLEQAAARGQHAAQDELGRLLLAGKGGPADELRGARMIRASADQMYGPAREQMVWLAALGIGMPASAAEASRWREAAAQVGLDGLDNLIGVREPVDEASRRFFESGLARAEERAARGDAGAQALLGTIYFLGIGVPADPARAVRWARAAGEAGDREALRTLGSAYSVGSGVPKDDRRSAEAFRRCAELGNSFCAMWFAWDLFRGEGVARDVPAAARWLERAGEAGNWWALGDLFNVAEGNWQPEVKPDPEKAVYWRRKRAAAGDQESVGWLRFRGLAVD